ncbi:MAG: serine/threonine protein kinase [Spirochaetales bacterium]|nr:serine/threonine protein kinase [Spirochaetales bacterium]
MSKLNYRNNTDEGQFTTLFPQLVIDAIEQTFGMVLDGVMTPYPSYINRVFGLTDENGNRFVVKYYRPGRWSPEAIKEEHEYLSDCAQAEIPVVTPILDSEGETLHELVLENNGSDVTYYFSLFPLKAGRNFEANSDDDWLRLGSLIGRVHSVGKTKKCVHRLECLPEKTTHPFFMELQKKEMVTPDEREEFYGLIEHGLKLITPLFEQVACHRIHGDCHAGNILDRANEGLLLFDFDDMMDGLAIQDLWLLLPDHAHKSMKEINLLIEGYQQFCPFDNSTLKLIEPLRFMRMVYFLVWCARQQSDYDFSRHFPGWGTKAFWFQEIEDFRAQIGIIEEILDEV